jgi:hypothetical protein
MSNWHLASIHHNILNGRRIRLDNLRMLRRTASRSQGKQQDNDAQDTDRDILLVSHRNFERLEQQIRQRIIVER